MIEISISRELADEHSGFMARCAEQDRAVEVFTPPARAQDGSVAADQEPGEASSGVRCGR